MDEVLCESKGTVTCLYRYLSRDVYVAPPIAAVIIVISINHSVILVKNNNLEV